MAAAVSIISLLTLFYSFLSHGLLKSEELKSERGLASELFQKWFEGGAAYGSIGNHTRNYFFSTVNYPPYLMEDVCLYKTNISHIVTNTPYHKLAGNGSNVFVDVYFLCAGVCCNFECCPTVKEMNGFVKFMGGVSVAIPIVLPLVAVLYITLSSKWFRTKVWPRLWSKLNICRIGAEEED